MSLNFDYSKVKNSDVITTHPKDVDKPREEQHLSPITESLIWKALSVRLGKITEENVDEWWFRVRLTQLVDGPEFNCGKDVKVYLTRQDIVNHIGLKTNADTFTRSKWAKEFMKINPIKLRSEQEQSAQEILTEFYKIGPKLGPKRGTEKG